MKDLSDSDVLMLQYIIFQLSKTNTEIVEKYSNESWLVHHWKNSTKESILTYRLHHNYRENYLKHKEEDILSSYIYKKEDSEKVVYLTFDDGPYKNQKPLVNYIFEQEIPSTFFLLCNKINSKNIQSYKKDFVSVGMHTYTHLNYDNLTRFAIEKDVSRCVETFNKYDLETRIFRPAFGIVNRDESEVLGNNNIEWIVWSMDSLDWEWVFNDSRIDEMLDSVTPWEIILLHENANLEMFKKLVEWLKKKGYSFWLL